MSGGMNVTDILFLSDKSLRRPALRSCCMPDAAEFCGKKFWFFFFFMDIVKLQIQKKRKGAFIFVQQSIQWRIAGDRWLRGSGRGGCQQWSAWFLYGRIPGIGGKRGRGTGAHCYAKFRLSSVIEKDHSESVSGKCKKRRHCL